MEIICENCKARLNIPDEKIPEEREITFSCPKCKNMLILEPSVPKQDNSVPKGARKTESGIGPTDTQAARKAESFPQDYYEEGVKLALVMEDKALQGEGLKQAVEEMGYTYVIAENTRDAIGKMRLHRFDLLILSDQFDGIALEQSPIIQYLNNLSMSIRRRIFFTLIGDTFKTIDPMMAFAASANLVINRGDLKKLKDVLTNAISDNERFYRVFMKSLETVGKA